MSFTRSLIYQPEVRMNFNSIKTKYGAVFFGLAGFFVLSIILNFSLISKTENGMTQLGQTFNLSISAVLNADRDLYQARVAELEAISSNSNTGAVNKAFQDYSENAQQAYDRMQKFAQLMVDYPETLNHMSKFRDSYRRWKDTSNQVFSLINSGQVEAAKELSEGNSLTYFEELREHYNTAGEAADNTSKRLSEDTLDYVGSTQTILTIISLLVVAATLAAGMLAPKAMSNALLELSQQLRGVNSGDGDLTRRIRSDRKDEVGTVANDLDDLLDGLSNLIKGIVNQSSGVITGVQQLNRGALKVQEISQLQTEKVDMIVTAVNEMSYAVKEVSQHASQTSNDIEEVNSLTDEGTRITHDAVEQMNRLSDSVQDAQSVISQLADNSQSIASVLDVIRGIAEQTNLLALNAAIEAARAGEQGRGFAVVADEVRTLASRTQESTQSIQEMIETLQTGVQQAVDSISKGSGLTEATVNLSQQTLTALENIGQACGRLSEVAIQTATATEEQSQVAEDISSNLTVLSDETKESFEVAQSNGVQANDTMGLATELSDSVTRFKLS